MTRADGYAAASIRLTGILADGADKQLEYLQGLERVLAETLNRVRECIGHAETMAHLEAEESVA